MSPKTFLVIFLVSILILGFLAWKVFAKPSVGRFEYGYFTKRVGIGTEKPEESLDVRGYIRTTKGFKFPDNSIQTTAAGESFWQARDSNLFTIAPVNIGLGTEMPTAKLEIAGDVIWTGTLKGGSVPWARLVDFPEVCPENQFIKGIGSSLLCETPTGLPSGTQGPTPATLSWSKITNFPQPCPAGQFVKGIGATLTCASPPAGPGGGIAGGTAGYLARWTSPTSLGNSIIYDTGVNVGIGTTQPSTRLSILSNADNILKLVRTGATSSYLWAIGTDGKLILKDQADNIRLAVDNTGKIGIGTANPGEKLEVAGYVRGTGFCIGTDCITSWPGGGPGGGDITAVLAGTGLSGGGTSGEVTLSADTNYLQRRVTGTCPAGSAMRVIATDGTVTCESTGGAGGGTLGGSGTPPALARWIGTPGVSSTTLGNSGVLYEVAGNIGIGTSNPGQKLEINGVTQAAVFYASTGISTFDANVSAGTIEASKFCLGNGTNCITSWPGGEGVSYWTQSGNNLYPANLAWNLGIGTSTPAYKLDISGDVRWTGTLQGGSVPWPRLTSFPSACPSGQYVSGIGTGGLTCSTPAGAGGDITAVLAGPGLSGGGTSGDVTLSLASQSCPAGQFVTGIGGAITCATPTGGGDITGVIAGSGLTGGGTSGDVTLNIGAGAGISVGADAISLKNISFSCGATNEALKSINIDTGVVTCEIDDIGAGGGVTGSGTANYLAKWTGSSFLGNSIIYDNGTNVGIGTNDPITKLDVRGDASLFNLSVNGLLKLIGGTGQPPRIASMGTVLDGGTGTGFVLQTVNSGGAYITRLRVTGGENISNFAIVESNVGIGLISPQAKLNLPYQGSGNTLLIGNTRDTGGNNYELTISLPYGAAHWPFGITKGLSVPGTGDWIFRIDPSGNVTKKGTVSFVQDHPKDPTKEIVYVSLEGPEAGTYLRGTSFCQKEVIINFPEHFSLVTAKESLNSQLTPRGKSFGLWIKEISNEKMVVGCSEEGSFDYLVNGVRKGYENFNPIQDKK